jgi:hexosaminidase
LREELVPATGYVLPLAGSGRSNAIELKLDPKLERLGKEGYRLSVTNKKIEIRAPQPNGIFYGIQTLRQLLPTAVYRKALVRRVTWRIPAVQIEDYPRFSWRGGHLDVARHFMPKEFLLKYIDLLALHKMNVFHLHLTEDQGWRIEIKKYPRLTEIGAWRKDTMLKTNPPTYEGKPHGGFYTQDDLREVVAYAKDRFINVVPEIEMPGHSQAAIAAYPELGNTGTQLEVWTDWGVSENTYNVEDSTIRFLQDVLTEVMDIFPSQVLHIGGDHQRILSMDSDYLDVTFKHILLPLWLSSYRYGNKTYSFQVNGQTGAVAGARPYSIWKILFLVLTVAAAIALIAFLAHTQGHP